MAKFYKGKCNKCGQCCNGMVLHISFKRFLIKWVKYIELNPNYKPRKECNKEAVFLAKNFKEISYENARVLNPSIRKREKDNYYYKCIALKNNKCSIHKDRFNVCRKYPNYPFHKRPVFLINQINCGFILNKKGMNFKDDLDYFRKQVGFND